MQGAGGLEIGTNGHLYVAEYGTGRILEYTSAGEQLNTFETEIIGPAGLTFNDDNLLYIAQFGSLDGEGMGTGSSVYRLDISDGSTELVFQDDSLKAPIEVVFDEKNDLYVTSGSSPILYRYDPSLGLIDFATVSGPSISGLGWVGWLISIAGSTPQYLGQTN